MASLLDALRQKSVIDCDTLDSEVAKSLGPFVDCTSNQAIAFFELTKLSAGGAGLHNESLIRESIYESISDLNEIRGQVPLNEFVVEVMMVKLQLLVAPHITGYVHVQTNPKLSYSQDGMVKNAERIIAIFRELSPDFDVKRICIKVPATWDGLCACRILEANGIATLATTMFCMEQAALASDANCTYIAPYINELKVHFETGYTDHNKAFSFCREAQAYYNANNYRTRVLAASLTSVDEVLQLAGVNHITISPILLHALSRLGASKAGKQLGQYFADEIPPESLDSKKYAGILQNESSWKLAFTRSGFGISEGKIIQAINYFSDFQDKLEGLAGRYTT
ncbi:transaldolase [Trichoderma arundinaceum]|uniref:Transaldolase n=1 Tax=Trichoderma arundinaceum TaxID=490622 RepID=A0A395NLP1_TRIAR|nr:transaldolase [Trichoderma arundinaceum]